LRGCIPGWTRTHREEFTERLLTLIAVELGDLQEHEAVASGYGRALGYEDVRSFRAGLASGEAGERHRDAVMRMLRP
jgi:hypothetical protein